MASKFYALLTTRGEAKLAQAVALGTQLKITQMAVGDGGGAIPTPNASQTKLVNQKRIAAINTLSVDPVNTSQIIAEQVIPEDEGGWWIREVGLFDDAGELIAIANCAETYKPQLAEGSGRTQVIRMVVIVSSTEAVTIKIDPSVVLATRKYVDDKVIEVKAYTDSVMKAHLDAADPHPQYAPKASPTFSGTPKAPTPANGNNSTQLATTQFVQAAIGLLKGDAPATLDTLVELAAAINNDPAFYSTMASQLALKAAIAGPTFTGVPKAPTAAVGNNTTQLATTQFVQSAIAQLVASSPAALDTLKELADALGNDPNFATTITNQLALKAPLASPALTGTPTAPTAGVAVNNTQIANTAFVQAILAAHLAAADPHTQYLLKTQRSSVINSASEDTVATSKAVKLVRDGALNIMGQVGSNRDLNTMGPTADYVGIWYISSNADLSGLTNAPEATGGILEVFGGGSYYGTQRFTTRSGAVYVRMLTANWNADSPAWAAWSLIGEQPIQGYINDANTALTPGTYSVTGAASNMPIASSPTGILEVKLRLSSNSLLQRFTSITTSSATINRTWQRTLSGTTWSPWTQTTLRPNELTTQTDANTLIESGSYYGNYTNGPSGSAYGFLEVIATGTTGVISQVYHATTANQRFIRTCTSANGWSAWVELVRADTVVNNLVPVGIPMPWPSATPPTGWVKCNGAAFSASTYPELAKAYPLLKLPDLRGEFIRGWDDGRGADAGREILSLQLDALQKLTGTLESANGVGIMSRPHDSTGGVFSEGPVRAQAPLSSTDKTGYAVTFDSSTIARSASETRPRNVAFNYIVRAA